MSYDLEKRRQERRKGTLELNETRRLPAAGREDVRCRQMNSRRRTMNVARRSTLRSVMPTEEAPPALRKDSL